MNRIGCIISTLTVWVNVWHVRFDEENEDDCNVFQERNRCKKRTAIGGAEDEVSCLAACEAKGFTCCEFGNGCNGGTEIDPNKGRKFRATLTCNPIAQTASPTPAPTHPPSVLEWTQSEVDAAKDLLLARFKKDIGKNRGGGFMPGTVLRLSFHDCIRYSDGTGGCDGCLNNNGGDGSMEVQHFPSETIGGKLADIEPIKEGELENNVLGRVASVLEDLYTSALSSTEARSLYELGKSRADFWALAGIVAVEYTIKVNNDVCESGRTPHQTIPGESEGQCLWAKIDGEEGCEAIPTRSLIFKTGRQDCRHGKTPAYTTDKVEKHPNPHMNGREIVEYMKSEFDFTGRETVAIMGAHTIGEYNQKFTGFKYVWTPRSERSFNNEYYRNIVLDPHWVFNNDDCDKLGDAYGEKGNSKWALKANRHDSNGGPIQWIRMTHRCPDCNETGENGDEDKGKEAREGTCCKDRPAGTWCTPDNNRTQEVDALEADDSEHGGCEKWVFLFDRDHALLSTDMGLYYEFDHDDLGFPTGCDSFNNYHPGEEFTSENIIGKKRGNAPKIQGGTIQHRWAWVDCPPQSLKEPADAPNTLAEIVEEFANDQNGWLDAYIPAMEKYLSNGYDELFDIV